jgi:predicted dehydrogenase
MKLNRRNLLQLATVAPLIGQTNSPNERIKIGMIGTGARAQELLQALLVLPGNEIVAVTDAYRGRIERAIERTGGRAKSYPNHRELLDKAGVDAVVVGTPDHLHKPIIMDVIAAGKDVYCEKPMTYTSAEGVEIIRAASQSKRMVQVGSQGMSSPLQQKAKELIKSGKLGQITTIRAAYNRNTASGAWIYPIPPDASPQTVNWDMFLGPAPKLPFSLERFFRWRCYQNYSGGIATDLFVHLCTTIHYLMDAKMPSRVVAMGERYRWKNSRDVPDTLNAILEYADGFVVNLSSTFNNESSPEEHLQILGTEGSLVLGGNLNFYPEHAVEDNRWIVESWPTALEQAYFRDQPAKPAAKVTPGVEQYRQEGPDATVLHLGHFLDSVRTRRPYWEDASAGHHAAACAHMINRSARERKMVEWDFQADDMHA